MPNRGARALLVGLCAAFACLTPSADAADLRHVLIDYAITGWSAKDGLPSNVISSIAQDADGYLWVGTDAGPVRFDGIRFVEWPTFGFRSDATAWVSSLCAGHDNSIWVGFGDRGAISRIRAGATRLYTSADGLDAHSPTAIVEDAHGVVWTATANGLYRFAGDRSQWRRQRTSVWSVVRCKSITAAPSSSASNGIYRFDETRQAFQFVSAASERGDHRRPRRRGGGHRSPGGIENSARPAFPTIRGSRPRPPAPSDRQGYLPVSTVGQGLWRRARRAGQLRLRPTRHGRHWPVERRHSIVARGSRRQRMGQETTEDWSG